VILHLDDLAFSVIVPASHPFYSLNSLHSYQMINSMVIEAIQMVLPLKGLLLQDDLPEAPRGGFCMAKPTKFDLLYEGKKVGGAAQRKTKNGLLHQSSLCLKMPDPMFLEQVLKSRTTAQDIMLSSASLGVQFKDDLKSAIIEVFT
jgi:lipoate-protein ligase A